MIGYFECHTCRDYNKHHSNDVNFKEYKQTTFDSVTEVFQHIRENPDHYVTLEAEQEDIDK